LLSCVPCARCLGMTMKASNHEPIQRTIRIGLSGSPLADTQCLAERDQAGGSVMTFMDRTVLNILSVMLGGAGLFVVLTKFNVPEVNMTFWDQNPFLVKRDAIEGVMTWIFTGLTLFGLLIQLVGEIFGDRLETRRYGSTFYVWIALATLILVLAVVWLLTKAGNRLAKRTWMPAIITMMTDAYTSARFIVDHDGWREDQFPTKDTLPDKETHRRTNFQTANERFSTIEKLLDLPPIKEKDLKSRRDRLKPFFEKTTSLSAL
jgi:hypothetical protein